MRCTQEQFDAIKPKSERIEAITSFEECTYLINNLDNNKGVISNIYGRYKRDHNREVYEEWDEKIFLDACGITTETLQDRLANLEKEIEEVKALIEEENEPKTGDICKFWDDDKNDFIIGKLEYADGTEVYPYEVRHGSVFKNCMKIINENFLKALNNL